MTRNLATLFGCSGTTLTPWERAFFGDAKPWGYILFRRNIETPEQVRQLTSALREASNDPEAPIFIDQEGGTVARLKAPHFRHPPNPNSFAQLFLEDPETAAEAAWLNARLMADELKELGINANCAPMLDVVDPTAHEFLQKRSLGQTSESVIALGKATALGLRDGGVAPVIKHAPGHGKGDADSHLDLPRVGASRTQLEAEDFQPFYSLRRESMLMTAHVLFESLDPHHPATLSRTIITDMIRGQWNYDGLIMTDDINMQALGGTIQERCTAALAAGCELICHCNGEKDDMLAVANTTPALANKAAQHAVKARAVALLEPKPFEKDAAIDRLKRLGLYEFIT